MPSAGPPRLTAYVRNDAKGVLGPTVPHQEPSNIDEFFADDQAWSKLGYGPNDAPPDSAKPTERQFPPPILDDIDQECLDRCKTWLANRLQELKDAHQQKMTEFALYEEAYKAAPAKFTAKTPYIGASTDITPVIAMAVDPVAARLDVGIMKQSPVFAVIPLRKSLVEYQECLEDWVQFNQAHRWKLRQIAAPRFVEFCKLGTMVFKTVYDRVEAPIKTWERDQGTKRFRQKKKRFVKFTGARVFGVPLDRFYFPPGYANIDDCPIVAERWTPTYEELRVAEASGKITDVAKLARKAPIRSTKSDIEDQQEINANHEEAVSYKNQYEVFEVWFDYDIDKDGYPESLVAIFEPETRTFLQLTYNWYFHQRKPYTTIPYTVQDGTLYGLGLGEMILPFQNAISRWQQMAQNNAYLANIRLYVAKKNSGIEEVPRLYPGRVFFVDDPSKDFKPFAASDIYPSTLTERQNLFGMVEKRTGVSDYLTGRESPVLGSRATATSTIALIQEGTKRVEQTLENIRHGFADIIEKAFCIWFQYGTEDLEDLVFGNDATAEKIENFFAGFSPEHVINGAIGVQLKAADAGDNKQARQQMQLAIINLMMGYLERQLQAGTQALEGIRAGIPEIAPMVADTLVAARKMFNDLLKHYDIRNPEQYLPELEKYLSVPPTSSSPYGSGAGATGGLPPGLPPELAGAAGLTGLEGVPGGAGGALPARPEGAPSSGRPPFLSPLTG